MSILHVFNPSHDEALAAGSPYYYPARIARALARDLAALPVAWAGTGDFVLLPDDLPATAMDGGVFVHEGELTAAFWDTVDAIDPWGWDALLRRRLAALGAPQRLLPDDAALDAVRRLSSRRTATRLLPLLRAAIPGTVGESYWCTTSEEVWRRVEQCGEAVVKAPWSGSGRGVFRVSAADAAGPGGSRCGRVSRILREQGAVEVEPLYRREADLAMEFRILSGGRAVYEGLSLFATTPSGGYAGNLVADEAGLYGRLPDEVLPALMAVRAAMPGLLSRVIGDGYTGLLGVDMMLVRHADATLRLHPCVEINLRRTMGSVALSLRRRLSAAMPCALYALRPVAIIGAEAVVLTPGAREMAAVLSPLNAENSQHLIGL